MTLKQLERALRGFGQRRPFRRFLIEFASGRNLAIAHPEAIRREDDLYVVRLPEGEHVVFAATSVTRLLDPPVEPNR